jgi:hypothetical protein
MLQQIETNQYLGPAAVLRTAGPRVQIELPDSQPWAQLAFAFPYAPDIGDTVLAIGQGDRWYVIGVLKGSGVTHLAVPGDLMLSAPHGRIELSGGRGVRLRGPVVQILAKKMQVAAHSLVERLGRAARTVADTFRLTAGRMRTRVEESYRVDAESISAVAEGDVKIDGRKIHLG